ncbi:MAG TPA: protocatechuate 3,4-dioxygenase subunit alpha [Microlunatus sp.]
MIIDAESTGPVEPKGPLVATPGQTVGPFFGYALPFPGDQELVPPGRADAVRLHGTVTDGAGAAVPDAILELWQADAAGRVVQQPGSLHRDGWTFTGWGRSSTDDSGHYTFSTVRPGPTGPGRPGLFMITLFARGVTNRLFTRAYLPDDTVALAADPLLASLDSEERASMITVAEPGGYRFDISLQGGRETVFLFYPGH